jgi:hypothetical protein
VKYDDNIFSEEQSESSGDRILPILNYVHFFPSIVN